MSPRTAPPTDVPTLTDIVHPPVPVPHNPAEKVSPECQERVVQRVLQSLEPVLHGRLQASVEALIRTQAQALVLPLQQEIERVVREAVKAALEQQSPALPEPLKSHPAACP